MWAAELTTHSGGFLNDWDQLGLDDLLGFNASGTLEFLYLDHDMDLHREHLVEFATLALRHTDPALRWWLMTALESTGETSFAHTRTLAEAVEAETGVRLDYWPSGTARVHTYVRRCGPLRPSPRTRTSRSA